jgi:Uma2 family endonuclease
MGALEDPVSLHRHRFSVADYYRLGEAGLLDPEKKTELIDGEVIEVAPMNSRHAGTVGRLAREVQFAVGRRALVLSQTPLALSARAEPQPDVMLLKARSDQYVKSHPTAADVLLLIEVAASSARFDREIKLPLYARSGVSHVWIVDLDAGLFRMFRSPAKGQYLDISATPTPGVIPLPGLRGASPDLSGILG